MIGDHQYFGVAPQTLGYGENCLAVNPLSFLMLQISIVTSCQI